MAKYTVVEPGLMASDQLDSLVKSVVGDVDLENGAHIVLGDMVDGDLNTYKAATPTDVENEEVLVVVSPVIVEINGLRVPWSNPEDFINPKDRPTTARHLKVGDTIVISERGFSSAPEVGQYAVPQNGSTKLAPAADLSGGTVVAYKVDKKKTIFIGQRYVNGYLLRVVKSA